MTSASDPKPSDGLNELLCTCALIRRSARKITQTYDTALKSTGLRITQYSILSNLDGQQNMSITDLAEVLEMDRTTLTRNLRPLQRDGLVQLSDAPDNRSKSLSVTSKGRQVLDMARPVWRKTEETVRTLVEGGELAELRRILQRVVSTDKD